MFTGIVEEIGIVKRTGKGREGYAIELDAPSIGETLEVGDSLAVNGACLTVAAKRGNLVTAEVMPETMDRTNIGELSPGDKVNLERALSLGGRLGGHLVSAHVDEIGIIERKSKKADAVLLKVSAPTTVTRYLVFRGSITMEGVSLTVIAFDNGSFTVSVAPHTLKATTLGQKREGDRVNLEVDMVAKYVERFTEERETEKSPKLSEEKLKELGFM